MYIFVCLKSQRCSNHSHIRQNSSVFVSLNCFQLITQASTQKTYEQAVQIYLCQWPFCIRHAGYIRGALNTKVHGASLICSYKSAILNKASLVYLRKYRSTHSWYNISMANYRSTVPCFLPDVKFFQQRKEERKNKNLMFHFAPS